jgi:hypothetical protein
MSHAQGSDSLLNRIAYLKISSYQEENDQYGTGTG